jgi:hypothetical protein
MNCEYCNKVGELRINKGEGGIGRDVFICNLCWKLLKNPVTALPLLRGHLTLSQRGIASPDHNKKMINKFMELISGWGNRN